MATKTFTDATGDGKWSTDSNWSPSPPASGDIVELDGHNLTLDVTLAIAISRVINSVSSAGLYFQAAHPISGDYLRDVRVPVFGDLVVGGTATVGVIGGGDLSSVTLSGTATLALSRDIINNVAKTYYLASATVGTGTKITVGGEATLIARNGAAMSLSGTLEVFYTISDTLIYGAVVLGTAVTLTVNSGGLLQVDGDGTYGGGTVTFDDGDSLVVSNGGTVSVQVNGKLAFSGDQPMTLATSGTGTVTLYGTLEVSSGSTLLYNSASAISIQSGGSLSVLGTLLCDSPLFAPSTAAQQLGDATLPSITGTRAVGVLAVRDSTGAYVLSISPLSLTISPFRDGVLDTQACVGYTYHGNNLYSMVVDFDINGTRDLPDEFAIDIYVEVTFGRNTASKWFHCRRMASIASTDADGSPAGTAAVATVSEVVSGTRYVRSTVYGFSGKLMETLNPATIGAKISAAFLSFFAVDLQATTGSVNSIPATDPTGSALATSAQLDDPTTGLAAIETAVSALPSAATIAATVWGYFCTAADVLGLTTMGGWLRNKVGNWLVNITPGYIGTVATAMAKNGAFEAVQNSNYTCSFPVLDTYGNAIDLSAVAGLAMVFADPNKPSQSAFTATIGGAHASLVVGGTSHNTVTLTIDKTLTATLRNLTWILGDATSKTVYVRGGTLRISPFPTW